MQPRAPERVPLLLIAVAVVITGGMAWTRTAASDAEPQRAPSATVPLPADSSTTTAPNGLHPGLGAAFDAAVAAARQAGHGLSMTSGFRTAAEQEALLAEAIAERGPVEALRWVFPPDRSMHVRGLAVDVGDGPAATWLDEHGARFGLCRTLAWEWWHFEWRPDWESASACPRPVRDPADAPDGPSAPADGEAR